MLSWRGRPVTVMVTIAILLWLRLGFTGFGKMLV
jgi:hypothetical protein